MAYVSIVDPHDDLLVVFLSSSQQRPPNGYSQALSRLDLASANPLSSRLVKPTRDQMSKSLVFPKKFTSSSIEIDVQSH